MGLIINTPGILYVKPVDTGSWTEIGQIVDAETAMIAAIQRTWDDMSPLLVAAYLYSFVWVN